MPTTTHRVQDLTSTERQVELNQVARSQIAKAVAGGREAIDQRLDALDSEWDVERTLQTNYAAVNAVGVALGTLVDRRWYALSMLATASMLQHALQGWCPPLPLFRKLGVRTASEINQERYALKAARGDFADFGKGWIDAQPVEEARTKAHA